MTKRQYWRCVRTMHWFAFGEAKAHHNVEPMRGIFFSNLIDLEWKCVRRYKENSNG